MTPQFPNRTDAGQQLAARLQEYANRSDVVVLALPRGGVPVGFAIAQALNLPLGICLVHKLEVPGHKHLVMGAIAADGVRVLNYDVVSSLGIKSKTIEQVAARELRELQRRDRAYRGDRPCPDLRNHTLIVVDEGMTTGTTMRAALGVLRQEHPAKIMIAVPVAPPEVCRALSAEVDRVICLLTPTPFYTIGFCYDNFAQVTDAEVHQLLDRSACLV